jgi:hypothetical protein
MVNYNSKSKVPNFFSLGYQEPLLFSFLVTGGRMEEVIQIKNKFNNEKMADAGNFIAVGISLIIFSLVIAAYKILISLSH